MKNLALTTFLVVLSFAAVRGQTPKWTNYTSEDQQFTVSFPGAPDVSNNFVDEQKGSQYSFTITNENFSYMVVVYDGAAFAGPFSEADLKFKYDAAQKGSLDKLTGANLISANDLKIGGVAARQVVADNDQAYVRTRFILTRKRIYVVLAIVPKSLESDPATKTGMTKFLDSFRFNELSRDVHSR